MCPANDDGVEKFLKAYGEHRHKGNEYILKEHYIRVEKRDDGGYTASKPFYCNIKRVAMAG